MNPFLASRLMSWPCGVAVTAAADQSARPRPRPQPGPAAPAAAQPRAPWPATVLARPPSGDVTLGGQARRRDTATPRSSGIPRDPQTASLLPSLHLGRTHRPSLRRSAATPSQSDDQRYGATGLYFKPGPFELDASYIRIPHHFGNDGRSLLERTAAPGPTSVENTTCSSGTRTPSPAVPRPASRHLRLPQRPGDPGPRARDSVRPRSWSAGAAASSSSSPAASRVDVRSQLLPRGPDRHAPQPEPSSGSATSSSCRSRWTTDPGRGGLREPGPPLGLRAWRPPLQLVQQRHPAC